MREYATMSDSKEDKETEDTQVTSRRREVTCTEIFVDVNYIFNSSSL